MTGFSGGAAAIRRSTLAAPGDVALLGGALEDRREIQAGGVDRAPGPELRARKIGHQPRGNRAGFGCRVSGEIQLVQWTGRFEMKRRMKIVAVERRHDAHELRQRQPR